MLANWPYFIAFLVFFLFVSFGCFILAINRNTRSVQHILAILFFAMAMSTLDVSLLISETYEVYLHFAFWLGVLAFAYGPLIYLFTRSALYTDRQLGLKDVVHFIPVIIYLLGVMTLYMPLPLTEKKILFEKASTDQSTLLSLVSSAAILSIIIYLCISYWLYRRYTQRLEDQYSSLEGKKLNWVKHVLFGFISLIAINALLQVIDTILSGFNLFEPFALVSLLVLLIFIMSTIYRGLRGDLSFGGISADGSIDLEAPKKTKLSIEEQSLIFNIETLMATDKPYLDSEVTLSSLSGLLDITDRQLSRLLNAGLNKSFFDYINAWRIKEVQSILIAEPRVTILECMYRCGFNSKSSFNTAFKKHTGATPTAYRKKNAK